MSWLEQKYINSISPNLKEFGIVTNNPLVVNFRCPYCGDSKKNTRKARGYLFEAGNTFKYFCHNCGISTNFFNFLKEQFPGVYTEYRFEKIKNKRSVEDVQSPTILAEEKINNFIIEENLGTSIENCIETNVVKQYVLKRKIPFVHHSRLFANTDIMSIISRYEKYKNLEITPTDTLVIPFFDENKTINYIIFRFINPKNNFRYLTLELNETKPKLWGLDCINWEKPIYVFEGPIDAMCFPNSLSLGGSSGYFAIDYIKNHVSELKNVCFCYDNELRTNKAIANQIKKRILENFSVVIFNNKIKSKDINEILTSGEMNEEELEEYINQRTFHGLKAKLEFATQIK